MLPVRLSNTEPNSDISIGWITARCMGGGGRCAKSLLRSPCWPQSFLKPAKCFKMPVIEVEVLHHQFQKPELVSGFFTSALYASLGGTSQIRLASATPFVSALWAPRGLSVLRFSLVVSRACARSLPVLARVRGRRVVVGKWLPPATEA